MPKRRAVDKLAGKSGFLEALRRRREAVSSGGLASAPEEFERGLRGTKKKKRRNNR